MRKIGLDDFFLKIPAFKKETFAGCQRVALDDPALKPLAAWYQKWEKRQRDGGDKGLTKILADEILRTDQFAKDAGDLLYVFDGGCYRPHGEARIARQVKRLLELNGDTAKWSSHRAREVSEFLRVDAPDLWERPPSNVLNLANGLLDISTGILAGHASTHLSPVQLPIAFDAEATCPLWESFTARVLPADCQTLPFEVLASAMRGEISDQTAVLLVGSGDNGKSTLLDAVVFALGSRNVSAIDLQRIESDKFAVAQLLGKLANVCADLPSAALEGTSNFKKLTGGDWMAGERKFQASFEFKPFARLLFSTNHYPTSKDASQAFFRRWLVIPFDAVLDPREKIENFAAQLASPGELSGALNRAMAALPGMNQRRGFTQSESTRVAMMEFREMTDPVAAWLDRFTVLSPEGVASKKDLGISYNAASEAASRPLMSAKFFYAAVRRLRPTIKEGQRTLGGEVKDVFLGLAMATQPPRTHTHPAVSTHDGGSKSNVENALNGLKGLSESKGASAHSAHSALFPQISLEELEGKEERIKAIKIGNELNELKGLNGAGSLPIVEDADIIDVGPP
jgi:putative DNA primase/helicase